MDTRFQIRINKELYEQFKIIAADNAQTPSLLVRKWIKNYVDNNKEELQMKWEFENYTVYEETDVLRFENNEGEVIGYVGNIHENNLIEDLNNGADPITDGWEDGVGNTISIEGWGN